MKRLPVLLGLAIACTIIFPSCFHHRDALHLSVRESDHYFTMIASFAESKTRRVEHYMDLKIGKRSRRSFINTNIDGEVALDDQTTFYIKKYPGLLKIKLNKAQNSDEALMRIRSMCEGIKEVLVR